jgi:CxxC motif-containing protein (DUF1111 family)
VRGGAPGGGSPLGGLTQDEQAFFNDGKSRFADTDVVTGGNNNGLGPRFNANSCLTCHVQPAAGGSSPAANPLIAIATLNGAKNNSRYSSNSLSAATSQPRYGQSKGEATNFAVARRRPFAACLIGLSFVPCHVILASCNLTTQSPS